MMESGLAFVHWQTHNPLPMAQRRSFFSTSALQRATPRPPRAVLITGASGGIGRAVSLAFAKAGWSIGVHYYQNKAAAEDIIRQIEASGSTGALFQADIRDRQAVQQMVESYSRQVTVPSAFVCNAGIGASQLVLRQGDAAWADVIATNLTGTFHCLQAMAPPLLAQGGGSIIVIGSHAGFHGSIGQAAYAASKAGLIGLVKTAVKEWGPQNVRVNLVLPGWQKTRLSEGSMPETDGWSDHALRRPASVEEVASTVLYLAQLKDVSGQVWNCDSRNL
jgi:3-oxoacyl-[acyl-carrier protein] reductase